MNPDSPPPPSREETDEIRRNLARIRHEQQRPPPKPQPGNPALAPCKTCGHPVSRRAKTCPHCGEEKPVPAPPLSPIVTYSFIILVVATAITYWPRHSGKPPDPGIAEDLRQESLHKKTAPLGDGEFTAGMEFAVRTNIERWIEKNRTPAGGDVDIENCRYPVNDGQGHHIINCTYLTDNIFGGKTKQNGAFTYNRTGDILSYRHLWP